MLNIQFSNLYQFDATPMTQHLQYANLQFKSDITWTYLQNE